VLDRGVARALSATRHWGLAGPSRESSTVTIRNTARARRTHRGDPADGAGGIRASIEKKYGKPLGEWMEIIASSPLTKHSELVNWLKADYGVGHGHATALVHLHKKASR